MSERLSEQVKEWLRECGYSEIDMAGLSGRTRLLHDMKLLGDTAEEQLVMLRDQFGVDMRRFEFNQYFPNEFSLDAFVLTLLPWHILRRLLVKYRPLSLGMIDRVLAEKKWVFD